MAMPSDGEMPPRPKPPHAYLSGNFAPIQQTCRLTPCQYTGIIPLDLAGGQYVRNGGNPLTNDDVGRDAHWFDGDGMLSGVLFRRMGEKGERVQPEFVNQYLLTDVYCYAKTSRFLRLPVLPSISTLVNPLSSVAGILWAVLRTVLFAILSRLAAPGAVLRKISAANTGVLFHDGRALATCESGPPLRFSLPTLETIGWFNGRTAVNEGSKQRHTAEKFGGDGPLSFMEEWTTAHPRVDPVTNELIAFHALFIKPFVRYSIVAPSKSLPSAPASTFNVGVPGISRPKMMHDFGVSREHTVIMDLPLTLDPRNLLHGLPVLSYDAKAASRFGVFPRYQPDLVQWFETKACVIFHTANCWDTRTSLHNNAVSETTVHMLACRLTSARLVFAAGNLPTPTTPPVPPEYAEEEQCRLYYYAFPLSPSGETPRIRHQFALSVIPFEFPTMSPAHAMQEARYIYGCTTGCGSYTVALGKAAKIDYLVKMDAQALIRRGTARPPQPVTGSVDTRSIAEILRSSSSDGDDPIKLFAMPPGWYAQEPRFVPRARPASEDDGWLLTYAFDEASQLRAEDGQCRADARSELWIIDARSMRDVVARVKLPQRVPYGLHGTWFSEEDIAAQRPWEKLRAVPSKEDGDNSCGFMASLRDWIEKCIG